MASSKMSTPFTHAESGSLGLSPGDGKFNANSTPSVSKPADLGSGDIPLKFEHSIKGNAENIRSPFEHQEMKTRK